MDNCRGRVFCGHLSVSAAQVAMSIRGYNGGTEGLQESERRHVLKYMQLNVDSASKKEIKKLCVWL